MLYRMVEELFSSRIDEDQGEADRYERRCT